MRDHLCHAALTGVQRQLPTSTRPHLPLQLPKATLICLLCPSHPPLPGQSVLTGLPARELTHSLHICVGFTKSPHLSKTCRRTWQIKPWFRMKTDPVKVFVVNLCFVF